jgi:hypothetical protein
MVDKLLWFLVIFLVLVVSAGAWWSLGQSPVPFVAGMTPAGAGCPAGTQVVWSQREGRQCLTAAELRAATHEAQPRSSYPMITLGPGVSCQGLPTWIACTCEGR